MPNNIIERIDLFIYSNLLIRVHKRETDIVQEKKVAMTK